MASLVRIQETPTWKKLLDYVGPGFLVSIAYLDPGNLQTDLQAGAYHKFELLWIVIVGLTFALMIQSRSANLGVVTGKHLSEHCKAEYPKKVNYCLWILAEIAIISVDIPEVLGIAFALNILLKVPIWAGVLVAGLNTLLLLGLQKYGIRKLEMAIGVLLMVVGTCFLAVMVRSKPSAKEMAIGMFVPKLMGEKATRDAVAMLGALIMPHNLFLHSALVISRKVPISFHGINSACKFFLIESGVALLVAFLINVAVVSVSGSVCSMPDLSVQNKTHCKSIALDSAAFLLKDTLGYWSSKLYAVSLLASGQSSTVTGTYAGQYVMEGFLDLKMKLWLRNLVTRCIAIVPSLVASIVGGSSGAGNLIICASLILSFELPFALIPLLRFTSSKTKMGRHKSSLMATLASWLLGVSLIGINLYFLGSSLMGWLASKRTSKVGSFITGVLVFPMMMAYMAMLGYLTLKKETVPVESPQWTTYSDETDETNGTELRKGSCPMSPKMIEEAVEADNIVSE